MPKRLYNGDKEPGRTPRCRIPQTDLVDPFIVADKYSYKTVQEAFEFKQRAVQGALHLSKLRGPLKAMHLVYADSITKQMRVLVEAQTLINREV